MQTLGGRPEIHYPCSWTYRIICTREDAVRAAVPGIVGPLAHRLQHLGASSAGRYQRLELVLEVRDEAHRNEIFAALGRLSEVRFVL
jgi:putative lipoic acid-binding regulatory protein